MKKNLIIILLLVTVLFVACKKPAENLEKPIDDSTVSNITVIDMDGKEINLDRLPERIVSLSPSNTEIVFALGAGDKLVGITSFCDYPEETSDIEKIGDFDGPNIELIKKAQPDVIFGGVYLQDDMIIALENLGIPIITTEASYFDDIFKSISLIGKLVDKEVTAETINIDLRNTIDDIKNKTKDLEKPNIFYVAWIEPLITTGTGTYVDDVIKISGAINIAKDVESWTQYSREELLKQNPDMAIIACHATNEGVTIEDIKNEIILRNLECVKKGNIYIMKDDNLISRPGPRIIEGIKEMTEAIHGDIF